MKKDYDPKYIELMKLIIKLRAKSPHFEVVEAYDVLRNLIIKLEKWYRTYGKFKEDRDDATDDL